MNLFVFTFAALGESANLGLQELQDLNATVVWASTEDGRVQEESALLHFLQRLLLRGNQGLRAGRGLLTPCHLDISIHNVTTELPWYSRAWNIKETQSRLQGQSVWRKNTFVGFSRGGGGGVGL